MVIRPFDNFQHTTKQSKTNHKTGLSTAQIQKQQQQYGKNEFSQAKEPGLISEIFQVLTQPLMLILLLAGGLSALIGEYKDAIGISMAVLLGIIIGRLTEGKAKKAAQSLAKMTDNITVKVLRDSKKQRIHKSELVVGDLVYLESGDQVPADGDIHSSTALLVREDMLTGEAEPVKKAADDVLFGGTFIGSGSAIMQVTAIGDETEMGKIAKLLDPEEQLTPLQLKLGALGAKISTISSSIAFVLFAYMVIQIFRDSHIQLNFSSVDQFKASLGDMDLIFPSIKTAFVVCVGLIVAAVPEGLPTMVNMMLAITMNQMAKINVLIRKKEACETIGGVSVICSDKTGTLTENKMQVSQIFVEGQFIDNSQINDYPILKLNCIVNSTADIEFKEHGPTYIGNPTEGALLLVTDPKTYHEQRLETHVVKQIPFSSARKQMSTLVHQEEDYISLVKGAPEVILKQCAYEIVEHKKQLLSKKRVEALLDTMEVFQANAMRVIAFAYKEVSPKTQIDETMMHSQLIFHGFVAIADPLREGVKESIALAREANIETKILTGDNIHTATAIGQELGLIQSGMRIVEASYIDQLSDEQLQAQINDIAIIARSLPATKLRVVEALQKNGEVVAVTGDGINDAPALSKADVGIAMGIAGTEVTRNAADIILTDDSFNTIIEAIKWGRGIYNNFQRFLQFSLSVNVIAFVVTIITQLLGMPLPFNTIHLLWVNIIMDGPPAFALGLEPVRDTVMTRKPTKKSASIINRLMVINILVNSTYMIALIYAQLKFNFLGIDLSRQVGDVTELQTVVFCLFATLILFNAFNCREFGLVSIVPNFFKNKKAIVAVLLTLGLQIGMTQFTGGFFHTLPLSAMLWVKIISISLSVILVNEIVKAMIRTLNKGRKQVRHQLRVPSRVK